MYIILYINGLTTCILCMYVHNLCTLTTCDIWTMDKNENENYHVLSLKAKQVALHNPPRAVVYIHTIHEPTLPSDVIRLPWPRMLGSYQIGSESAEHSKREEPLGWILGCNYVQSTHSSRALLSDWPSSSVGSWFVLSPEMMELSAYLHVDLQGIQCTVHVNIKLSVLYTVLDKEDLLNWVYGILFAG